MGSSMKNYLYSGKKKTKTTHMFVKLRILSIVVETPKWSYGVWLLIRNKPKDWLHVLRLNNDAQDFNKCKQSNLRIYH